MVSAARMELAEAAAELRAAGALQREVAVALGVSRSYAAELLTDPEGVAARGRKRSYAGTCRGCGGPTDGSNGRSAAPDRCRRCTRADLKPCGTHASYRRGCRCDACVEAHRVYNRAHPEWRRGGKSRVGGA